VDALPARPFRRSFRTVLPRLARQSPVARVAVDNSIRRSAHPTPTYFPSRPCTSPPRGCFLTVDPAGTRSVGVYPTRPLRTPLLSGIYRAPRSPWGPNLKSVMVTCPGPNWPSHTPCMKFFPGASFRGVIGSSTRKGVGPEGGLAASTCSSSPSHAECVDGGRIGKCQVPAPARRTVPRPSASRPPVIGTEHLERSPASICGSSHRRSHGSGKNGVRVFWRRFLVECLGRRSIRK